MPKLRVFCPEDSTHQRFVTTAHVMQEWLVGEKGEFLKRLDTLETSSPPHPDNKWTCYECGKPAKVIVGGA